MLFAAFLHALPYVLGGALCLFLLYGFWRGWSLRPHAREHRLGCRAYSYCHRILLRARNYGLCVPKIRFCNIGEVGGHSGTRSIALCRGRSCTLTRTTTCPFRDTIAWHGT
jgi:hypothetical protein